MSFKTGFLFLVPADLALICWVKVETFLTGRTRIPAAFLQLCSGSGWREAWNFKIQ